jgi:HK97 family phage portal protein
MVGANASGIPVTQQTAEGIAAVYGCVGLIADSVSSLPIELRTGPTRKGTGLLKPTPLLLKPYAEISRRDWWTQFIWSLALRGNFYGQVIQRDGQGFPVQIKPIHNDAVQMWRDQASGEIVYRFYGAKIPLQDVFHVRYQSTSGNIIGLNPIQVMALTFGNAVAQQRFVESFFLNSANPMGVIEVPGYLDRAETRKMMRSWIAAHQGLGAANLPAILTDSATFKPITISPNDAQLLEALGFSEQQICGRIFRVPPHMVGIVDKTTCLPADAQVFTTDGPKAIVDVRAGDEVWSLGDHGIEPATVTAQEMTGHKPLLSIETIGRTVRATANHVIPVRRYFGRDAGRQPGECGWENVWVRADEIVVGDYLMVPHGFGDTDGEHAPNGRRLTVEAMEFCGLYTGDGSQDHNRFEIAHESDHTEFGGAYVDTAEATHTKRVPAWVFGLNRELQFAFLRGYLDAAGSMAHGRIIYSSCHRMLLEDVRHLCMQVGVPVGRVHLRHSSGRRVSDPTYQFRIEQEDPNWHTPGVILQRVRRIVVGKTEEAVYDLSVAGNHTFLAEGVVVHNSWGRLPRHRAARTRVLHQHARRLLVDRQGSTHRLPSRRPVRPVRHHSTRTRSDIGAGAGRRIVDDIRRRPGRRCARLV